MDGIGKGLGIGTGLAVRDLRMGRFEIDDARQKDPLDPFLDQVEDMAVTHLDRETGLCDDILHPFSNQFFIRGIGEDDPVAQFRKEGLPERKHLVEIEDPRDADLRGIGWEGPLLPG